MSIAALSPKNPKFMLLLLAAGAIMLTRRANARAMNGSAATPQAAALRYSISPGTAQAAGAGLGGQISAVTTLLNVGKSVLNSVSPNRVASGPYGDYFPGQLGTSSSAVADGTVGEGAAQAFYQNNMASFAAPDPVITDDMSDAAMREGLSEY